MITTRMFAQAGAAFIMAAGLALPSHAEIRLNQLKVQGDASRFTISSPFATSEGSRIGFTNSISKSTRLSSLFRFERQIKGVTRTLAGSGSLFVVQKGQMLTEATLRSGKLSPIDTDHSAYVGRDFWMAIGLKPFTQEGYNAATPYAEFAWAHIRFNAQGVPELLDSATAVNEPGIIVGEKTPCLPCQPTPP